MRDYAKLTSARAICEYIEKNGDGKVDRGVITTALKEGWNPIAERIMWPDGRYVRCNNES